jgi:hypothetical protein
MPLMKRARWSSPLHGGLSDGTSEFQSAAPSLVNLLTTNASWIPFYVDSFLWNRPGR